MGDKRRGHTPRSRSRAAQDILKKTTLEEDTDLVRRTEIMAPPGTLGHMLRLCHNIRAQRHEITHAKGLVQEGDGESVAVTVQDTMANLKLARESAPGLANSEAAG